MTKLFENKSECCGCMACLEICPVNGITLETDKEGFAYPKIDKAICIDCDKCRKVCPIKNNSVSKENIEEYYGARTKEESIREKSSSGGFFSTLASEVLKNGGIVYGAGYDENMEVVHKKAETVQELDNIRRTKYIQSKLLLFSEIRENLENNRQVLFVGTGCQVQGLKNYLDKEYDNLILTDLICFGVPSPGIWKEYTAYLEKKHRGKLEDFSFRDKRAKDNGHTISYKINGKEFAYSMYKDPFAQMFFKGLSVRPSCFSCNFCTTSRNSDFTIGDFWGIEKNRPDMEDGMGNSVLIIHSQKGKQKFNKIKEHLIFWPCQKEEILQPRLETPTGCPEKRDLFMKLYNRLPFSWFLKVTGKLK